MTAAAIKIKALWRNRPACINAGNALTAGLLLCLGYAFCRGFYMPNIWSTNYWLINFFDGFGRRALLGTLLYPFGDLRLHYHFIAAIQIATSTTLLALIVTRLTVWHQKQAKNHIYVYIYGLLLSCYGAFFFGTVGYIDHAHYLVIFLALLAPSCAARVLLASSTIWMHEAAAFTCLPLYFTIEWLHFDRRREAIITLALSLASFIIIHTFYQTADASVTESYEIGFLARANYKPRLDYLSVFSEQFTGKRFRPHTYYGGVYKSYAIYCLMLAIILAQGCTTLKKGRNSAASTMLICLAAASPLAMGFFAWDTNRWIFLALANSAVLFTVFQWQMNTAWRRSFIAASLIIFFSSHIQLFDHHHYRSAHEFIPFLQNLGAFVTSTPQL